MKLLSLPAAAALLLISAAPAPAAISVDFSGGNSSPLSFTLPAISWTINNAPGFHGISLFGIGISVGQTPEYSSNGTAQGGDASAWTSDGDITFVPDESPFSFYENNYGSSGLNVGGIIWFGMASNPHAADNDIVTFAGGTLGASYAISSFADGNYDVYLISATGDVVSTAGVAAVPEPSSLLLGAIGALGLLRRRRNEG